MDILMACFKLGILGFVVGHVALLFAIYQVGKRHPERVRAFGRRVAWFLLGPGTPPGGATAVA